MSNGGETASRGFIFQAVVALIECLDPDNDWDQIKNEPNTDEDKVDIILYKDGKPRSAIQVKSSINDFERADVKGWLESLKSDAKDAENVCLYLVGDTFTSSCERFIEENRSEIKTVPFKNLQGLSTERLVEYIKSKGDWVFRNEDRKFINEALFAKLFTNSISVEPVSRREFEEQFKRALPVHIIPKCLTPVPTVNRAVGLVGRDDIKKTVRDMLEENDRMALVNGLGGIGKTAVMQHICNDLKNEEKYVAWIECGDSLKEDLLLLRSALGIPESVKSDEAYKEIEKELKANRQLAGNLYLFLDNLSRKLSDEEQEILNGLHIHVMATSRFSHDYFMNLPLDVLEETAALDMFYGYYLERQTDKTRRFIDAAREIVGSVQNHTLLVELLAKAAAKKGGTLEDFRNNLKTLGVFDVFKRNLSTKHDRNRTIEECVIELYKISNLSSAQQRIMKLFTIFTPEKEIFYKIGEWAALDMDAMDQLVDLGWLEQGGLENGYYIHQIIRDSIARQVIRDGEKVRLEDYANFLESTIGTSSYLGSEITYEKIRERLVLTGDVARFFDESSREDVIAATLFNNIAGVYQYLGNYDCALEFFEKALFIHKKVLGKDHPDTAITYNNMAGVFYYLGNFGSALEFYKKALAIREKVLGKNHPDTATTYNNMAGVFLYLADYDKALEFFEKALIIREKLLGMNHPDTATTYNNIACVFRAQGNYDRALKYYEKGMIISENVLGKDHPDTATSYNTIAGVYQDQGNYDRALEFLKKALIIREKVLGKDHPDTAITYNNLGDVYKNLGNYDRALEFLKKALIINETELGKDHPSMAATYNNLAGVYEDLGNYKRALEYYKKSLVIYENVLGKDHPSTAATYNNLAGVYRAQSDYDKALEYYGKALIISENVLGKAHPSTATTYNNLAGVYQEQGNYDRALEYYKKSLVIREKILGKNHPSTANTYNNMAGVYLDQGNFDSALVYYEKTLVIREKVLGLDHPSIANTCNNIAFLYLAQRDYDRALEYYKKAHRIFLAVFGENHPHTRDTAISIKILDLLLMKGMTEDELIAALNSSLSE